MVSTDCAARFLVQNNKYVLGLWVLASFTGLYYAPNLFKCFEIAYVHGTETESGRAADVLRKGLPEWQDRMEDVVTIWCDDCETVVGPESRRVMNKLGGWMEGVSQRFPGLIKNHESYFDMEAAGSQNPYLSPDKKTMLFHWSFAAKVSIRDAFDLFNTEVEALNKESPLNIVSSGPYANFRDAEKSMTAYIIRDEAMVVPLIAGILWFMLGSLKRSMVPFMCAQISIVCTWSTLLFIKRMVWTDFNMVITLPFVTAAFAVALCVDYGLFLWGRFGEERAKGVILEESIAIMLGYSGHVVVVSGCVMMLAYFSVMCFPHSNSIEIFSLGLGNMLAAFYSIITSLTITPAAIACFPQHFDSDTSEHERLFRRLKPGKYWKKWAVMITRPPWIVLVPLITYMLIAPVAMQLTTMVPAFNTWNLLMAHTTPAYAGHTRMEQAFPRGATMPMMVALQLTDSQHDSKIGLQLNQKKLDSRALLRQTGASDFTGIMPKFMDPSQNPFLKSISKFFPSGESDQINSMTAPMSFMQTGMWQEMADAMANSDMGGMAETVADAAGGSKKMTSFMQTDAHANSPIRSPEFFTYSCALIKDIIKETKGTPHQIDGEDILSLFYLPPSKAGPFGDKNGACINAHLAKLLLAQDAKSLELLGLPQKLNLGKHYQTAYQKLANDDGQISVMLIRPQFDPMGPYGPEAAKAIRKVLPKYRGVLEIGENNYAADSSFFSILSFMMDIQTQLYAAAPRVLGMTMMIMFGLIAVMFRSAFIPFKLFMTVVIPLTFVYGAAVAVFQNGALDWMGMDQLRSMGGVSWEMPLFTICVLMGLALDYDIFLFARVMEYRQKGYDNRSAVVKGMCQTGPIISAAGTIMALAFMGNMLGPFGYDNQIGFIMCVGVLVDTFLIRLCLVPCFLCMMESLNYWPMKMPVPTKMDPCIGANAKPEDFELEEEE